MFWLKIIIIFIQVKIISIKVESKFLSGNDIWVNVIKFKPNWVNCLNKIMVKYQFTTQWVINITILLTKFSFLITLAGSLNYETVLKKNSL